jgi:mercuric ion transport protein
MEETGSKRILWTGSIGAVIAAVCCVTPLLVMLLGLLGLGALTGYLDYVLLPALLIFIGMIAYGLYRQRSLAEPHCCARQSDIRVASKRRGGEAHE